MPSHQCLLSSIAVGSRWFRNSRSSKYWYGYRRQQHSGIEKYEELVVEHYKEPENGTFNDATTSVLAALMSSNEEDDNSDSESGPEAKL